MREQLEARLNELARRAGLAGMPPAAVWAACALCVVVIGGAAWRWWPRQEAPAGTSSAMEMAAGAGGAEGTHGTASGSGAGADASRGPGQAESTAGAGAGESHVYVHVVGAVRHPGMYELGAGSRVDDAIAAAGGFLGNAAQAGVNLARQVTDGEQIVVPTADEFASGGAASAGGAATAASGGQTGAGGSAGGAAVNINTADAAALDTLPGVGPSTAAKIVADREANGPFSSADDLGRVPGIGPKKLEELKPRVCVR